MTQTRRDFLRCALGVSGLAATGWATLGRDSHATARRAALRFLADRQSDDGAWRSSHYAAFREGDALTPVVLWAMHERGESFDRGLRWLRRLTDELPSSEPWVAVQYPLFTASYSAQVFAKVGDAPRAAVWAALAEQLRISPALSWPAGDPACGAWSDSPTPPHLPPGLSAPPDMVAPNLSATVLGVQALTAAGLKARAATARPFIEQCQNFSTDDGGFFFTPGDPIRNKAGIASRDEHGNLRFNSYGSATCDGLLALIECGATMDDPRVRAALRWLQQHTGGLRHSGEWAQGRASARESLAFYHAQALAAVLALPFPHRETAAWAARQRLVLEADLAAQQSPDGSWTGTAPESCEDDPLLATAFALRAMQAVPFATT